MKGNKMKRWLSLVLCLCMLLGMLPWMTTPASAAAYDVYATSSTSGHRYHLTITGFERRDINGDVYNFYGNMQGIVCDSVTETDTQVTFVANLYFAYVNGGTAKDQVTITVDKTVCNQSFSTSIQKQMDQSYDFYVTVQVDRSAYNHQGSATCTTAAKCSVCGVVATIADHHNYVWKWSNDTHYQLCSYGCGSRLNEGNCSYSQADCVSASVCTTCGYEKSGFATDAHDWSNWNSNGDGTHTRTCARDAQHKETDNCSGSATCTEKAYCDICASSYGESLGHSTDKEGDRPKTCTEPGYCSVCQQEYGASDLADHTYDANGFCTACDDYQPATDSNSDGYYEIGNAGQLYWFCQKVYNNNKMNAVLTADIVVNRKVLNEDGTLVSDTDSLRPWVAIGSNNSTTIIYSGIFDGRNHTISGLYSGDSSATTVGLFGASRGTIKNLGVVDSYFNSTFRTGAIVGWNNNGGTVINCFAMVKFVSSSAGGIAGWNGGTVTNCYYLNTLVSGGIGESDVSGSAEGKTPAQFAGGEVTYLLSGGVTDGTQGWYQTIGTDLYPRYTGKTVYVVAASCDGTSPVYGNTYTDKPGVTHIAYENGFCTICGAYEPATDTNSDGYYEIGNAGQLFWFAQLVNGGQKSAKAILTADIDLQNRAWTPIGHYSDTDKTNLVEYAGTFDGRNHVIKNLNVKVETTHETGLFSRVTGGTLKNFGVINATVENTQSIRCGVIAGEIHKSTVTNVFSAGNITITTDHTHETYGKQAGGIAGECASSTLTNCYTTYGMLSITNSITANNCYYMADNTNSKSAGTAMSESRFVSGEVAYKLSSAWGQTIGTDSYPTLGGAKVYQVRNCKSENAYSNTNANIDHLWESGVCTVCGKVCVHGWENGTCTVCGTACAHSYDNVTCTVCGYVHIAATVTIGGNTVNYSSLEAAIEAVKDCTAESEAKVTLAENIALGTNYVQIKSGVFTLDLNGFTISETGFRYGVLYLNDRSVELTVADSVGTGKITGDSYGIYVSNGRLRVTGGFISGGYAIYTFGQAVTILGGTIQGTNYDLYDAVGDNTLGLGPDGVGATFPGGIKVSRTLNALLADGAAFWSDDTMIVPGDKDSEISGKGDIVIKPACTHSTGARSYADQGQYHFEHWSCCNADIRQEHTIDQTTGECTICYGMATALVAVNGSQTYYVDLAEAVRAITGCTQQDNACIKLLINVDLGDNAQIVSNSAFTLDLNGFELSGEDYYDGVLRLKGCKATIVDSGTTGKINGKYDGLSVSNSTLTITGGSFNGKEQSAVDVLNNSQVIITGGTFTGYRGVYAALDTSAVITGGSFDCSMDLEGQNIKLTVDENGMGATFINNITVYNTTLNNAIVAGVKYWAGETVLTVRDGATSITNQSEILVKAICDHAGNENQEDGICDTAFACSVCGFVFTEAKVHSFVYQVNDDDTHTGTCTVCGTVVTEAHNVDNLACPCGLASEETVAIVIKNGTVIAGYSTLSKAINAVSGATMWDNAVLKLMKSVDLGSDYQRIDGGIFTIDLNGCHISSTGSECLYLSSSSVNLTITDTGVGGSISASGSRSNGIYAYDVTLNINGGTVTGSGYGVFSSSGTLNINGGAVTGSNYGVYSYGGTANINGGTVTGSNYGVYVSYGTLTISGGRISGGLYNYSSKITLTLGADGEGATFVGGIRCDGSSSSNISWKLKDILADGAAYWQGNTMISVGDSATHISGGDVTVRKACEHKGDVSYQNNGDDHSVICSDCNSASTENHSFASDTTPCICGAEATVITTVDGDNLYHATLNKAIQTVKDCTAEDQAVVTLLKELDLGSSYQLIGSGVFTIDLNGCSISSTGEYALMLNGSGVDVTIIDSQGDGSISGKYEAVYVSDSNVTVTGGTFTSASCGMYFKNANAVISGGTFIGKSYGLNVSGGTVTITDGTFTGESDGIDITSNSDVTISGGSFYGPFYGAYISSSTVTVSGGSITGYLYTYNSTFTLTLEEDAVGATFVGGIDSNTKLNELIGDGAAYWQGSAMIIPGTNDKSITGGDVVIKSVCDHVGTTHTTSTDNADGTHSFTCTFCTTIGTEDHITTQAATCVTKAVCGLCGEYGEVNSENHVSSRTAVFHWPEVAGDYMYVTADLTCACGKVMASGSAYHDEIFLIGSAEGTDCGNPSTETYSTTITMDGQEYTDTHTYKLPTDNHVGEFVNGFCSVCDAYQKPVVDPGEDAEWDYDDVYLIYNAGQLYWFASYVNNVNNGITGKLMADIDLNPGYTFNADGTYTGGDSPRAWTPIGFGYTCYAGSFDGNGFTVSGAYTVSDYSYIGLFGNTDYYYEIKNLGITNSYFEGSDHVGGLAGYAYSYIYNCYVTDTVYVSGNYNTAALIGYNGGEVYNSYAMAEMMVDYSYGSFYNCYALSEDDGITAVTMDAFTSGEVAYLLQSGVPSEDIYDEDWNYVETVIPEIWGQTIGEDAYPVIFGDPVYQILDCDGVSTTYSNTNSNKDHTYDNVCDTDCNVCGDVREIVHPGVIASKDNGNGTHTAQYNCCGLVIGESTSHVFDSTGICDCDAVAVAKVGDAFYWDMNLALLDAETIADCTVVLWRDLDIDRYLTITKGTFTLDLNGHKITSYHKYGYVLYIYTRGTFTLCDSVGGGELSIGERDRSAIYFSNGTFNFVSGKITSDGTGIYSSYATVNISGGTITSRSSTVQGDQGTLNITGGILTSQYSGVWLNNTCRCSITGGTITGGTDDIYMSVTYPTDGVFSPFIGFDATTGTGPVFPGGLTVAGVKAVDVNDFIVEGAAYWAGNTQLQPADGVTELTGVGDITVKAACNHANQETIPGKASTCTEPGLTDGVICTVCGETLTAQEEIPAGHSYENDVCTRCGHIGVPVKLDSASLSFEEEIHYNIFFALGLDETVALSDMGLILFDSLNADGTMDDAIAVYAGAVERDGKYMVATDGVPAKYMGDTIYFRVYVRLADGSYVYSKTAQYSAVTYAENILAGDQSESAKALVVAMLNYGAAAQQFFGYNTDALVNAFLTEEQKALPEQYRDDMVNSVPVVAAEKQGIFANNKGFSTRIPSVSFESAFRINYVFTPAYAPVDGIILYYWTEADFNAADVLTEENASGSLKLEDNRGHIGGIAAKNLSDNIYVAAVYSDGTTTWTSGVLGYSIGAYCASQSGKNGTIADLAMATAVYGYHAKAFFG